MEPIKTLGLIIKETMSSDSDKFITVLTKDYGKVSLFIKGAVKNKSKFSASSKIFNYGQFVYQKNNNGLNILSDIVIFEDFYEISKDYLSFAYGSYFCNLTDETVQEEIEENHILKLLFMALKKICTEGSKELICSTFEYKLMQLNGVIPLINECSVCKSKNVYSLGNNGAYCKEHSVRESINISGSVLKALRYIQENDIGRVFSFTMDREYIPEMRAVVHRYMKYNFTEEPKSYHFLRSLVSKT